jgi:hypothetical protein
MKRVRDGRLADATLAKEYSVLPVFQDRINKAADLIPPPRNGFCVPNRG